MRLQEIKIIVLLRIAMGLTYLGEHVWKKSCSD